MGRTEQCGVGALLSINGHTRSIKRFYDKLSPRVGHPRDRDNLHLTLVNSAETAVPIFSERDLITVRNTRRRIADYLGKLPLSEIVFHPKTSQLEKLGRSACVIVEKTAFLDEVRGDLGEITSKELGQGLSSRSYIPHIAVMSLAKGKNPPSNPHSPQSFHVNGFLAGQRFSTDRISHNQGESYVNYLRPSQG